MRGGEGRRVEGPPPRRRRRPPAVSYCEKPAGKTTIRPGRSRSGGACAPRSARAPCVMTRIARSWTLAHTTSLSTAEPPE